MMFERCSIERNTQFENAIFLEWKDWGREFIAAEKMEGPPASRTFEGANPSRLVLSPDPQITDRVGYQGKF